MYFAESDVSHRRPRSLTGRFPMALALFEAVRPVPVPQLGDRRIGRDTYTGAEPSECPSAVRDRAQSRPARETQQAMAGRDAAGPCVDRGVAVQLRLTGELQIEDLRADAECL